MSQGRNWCFTLNNPQVGDEAILLATVYDGLACYIIFQEEKAESGTLHYQGYIEVFNQTRLNALKNAIGIRRIHLEVRRGTQSDAIEYCKKDDSSTGQGVYEAGEPRRGRGRPAVKDYEEAAEAVANGATMLEVCEANPGVYGLRHKELKAIQERLAKPRDWAMNIEVYYGPTGCGKSMSAHKVLKELGPSKVYWASWPTGGRWWWPDYEGQDVVILDEFRHQISMDKMLHLMDRYPFPIEYKYGNTTFRSRKIIITSNIPPERWFPKVEDVSMLRRRLTEFAKLYKYSRMSSVLDEDGDIIMNATPHINRRLVSLADRPDDCGRQEPSSQVYDFSRNGRNGLRTDGDMDDGGIDGVMFD